MLVQEWEETALRVLGNSFEVLLNANIGILNSSEGPRELLGRLSGGF